MILMLFGLMAPAVTAIVTVRTSGSRALKLDLRRKLVGFYRIKPMSILTRIGMILAYVAVALLLAGTGLLRSNGLMERAPLLGSFVDVTGVTTSQALTFRTDWVKYEAYVAADGQVLGLSSEPSVDADCPPYTLAPVVEFAAELPMTA